MANYESNVDQTSFLVGLIGNGISASFSPRLHQAEADALGLRLIYQLIDLSGRSDRLGAVLDAAQELGFAGVNITHPYKQAVLPHLDELSSEASQIGAVNTVVFGENGRKGHNTDEIGYRDSFVEELAQKDRTCVVQLGAGGAGAAIAVSLLRLGVSELRLLDREVDRAHALASRLRSSGTCAKIVVYDNPSAALLEASGVVNATPIGMAAYPGTAVSPELLTPHMWVSDIIYVPPRTELLNEASKRGCAIMNGFGMVVYQAAAAFQRFTGHFPDKIRMKQSMAMMK